MSNRWIISDTHFLHSNMLNFLDTDGVPFRGQYFSNQDELDEYMIENWNAKVKPQDTIWHLGDVFIGDIERFEKIWPRLQGKKRLIVGNHDDIRYLSGKINGEWIFQKIKMWNIMPEYDCIMTHVPMQMENTYEGSKIRFNIHGHIHNNKSPTDRHYNASVEAIRYAPEHIDDIVYKLKRRNGNLS